MQMEIIFECLCVSGISHSFLALKGTNMSLFVCVVPHPATCPTTYHLLICTPASDCAAFERALDGALTLSNEHD